MANPATDEISDEELEELKEKGEQWMTAEEARLLPGYHAPRWWFGTARKMGFGILATRFLWILHWRKEVRREGGFLPKNSCY